MAENYKNGFEEENFLFGKNKENPFSAPEGYFDSLTNKLINKTEIVQETKQYALLSGIERGEPFAVPENYFIKNENLLEYKYELSACVELGMAEKPVLKPVPEKYFDTLSDKILKKIELTEELKDYSALAEISKEKVFAVDPDYFETFADKVKERYHSNADQKASIIEQVLSFIFKPKMVVSYAAVLVVGIGMFFFFNQPQTGIDSGDCKTLACLERKELLNDRTIQNLDDDNLYDLVDIDMLDKQLSGETADSLATGNTDSLPQELE